MFSRPPWQKNPKNKRDISKFCQYNKNYGHDTDNYRNLNIEIEKLIQRGQLKEYVHKQTQSVNKRFDKNKSRCRDSPPNIIGRVNVISGGRSGGGDSGSARRAYAKRDIYAATMGAGPEFPDFSFSGKDFEGIECPHEDPLVSTPESMDPTGSGGKSQEGETV
ncbi:hypothetical protein LIER_18227 [Lithospermum erythrorhizon]|uniref:Uncharacterized protein n=1 Tax=Lithospermum erythrorhizon TaxID=34254 RepID=A0AAV3QD75_LITER